MPPYWFVFDLDETLTHVNTYFSLVCTFFQNDFALNAKRLNLAKPIPQQLEIPLQEAYTIFIEECANAEKTNEPLGILRPGIIDLFTRIGELKDNGLAGGAFIYSNNSTRSLLQFIADIIHAATEKDGLICDIVHLNDNRRNSEGATKTFRTIQKIIQEIKCGGSAPAPSDVFFFDDLVHPDIQSKIGENYIQVDPYTYNINADKCIDIYFNSLRKAGILDTTPELQKEFFKYISTGCFKSVYPEISSSAFRSIVKSSFGRKSQLPYLPPAPDTNLQPIINKVSQIKYSNQTAGRRKIPKRIYTKKRARKNLRKNRTKWRHQWA